VSSLGGVCDSSAVGGASDGEQRHIIDHRGSATEEEPGYECEGSPFIVGYPALCAVKAAF
jgi:hypothetical protein